MSYPSLQRILFDVRVKNSQYSEIQKNFRLPDFKEQFFTKKLDKKIAP